MDTLITFLKTALPITATIVVTIFIFAGPTVWPMIRKRLDRYFDGGLLNDLASLTEFELELLRDTAKAGKDQLRVLARRHDDAPTRPISFVRDVHLCRLANYLADQGDPAQKLEYLERKRTAR